ncbi:MAG: glutamate carboxypeptidase [Hyphomicrobiales bacterium]|jgi:glutamate carboxypeptidase|nr:glutamate carboxypeptidase [Hyphomicrobiales bacterium]
MNIMQQAHSIDVAAMIGGIQRWVEIESPTQSTAAVNRMIDQVQSDVAGLAVKVERVRGTNGFGDNLIVRNDAAGDGAGILLLSHIDTVHPIGTLAGPLPFRRDGDKLYGPGLFDMKGGAYLALEAFRQVAQAGNAKLPVTYLFTPDEEVGSPTSRHLIESEARRARYVLVTEPARDGGKIVTSRKGVGRFEMKATGIPAHSGARHQDGRSAIKEMARQVLAIEAMTDYARGVTTTVGVISGGTAPNVIPQHCRITVDLRVRDEAAGAEFEAKILGLEPFDPGVKLDVTGGMNRPPFEKTTAIDVLFRHAQAIAKGIGFDLQHTEMAGGGSDGNFTAALGVPTLDGLGIDGDGAHTEWEHGLISSIEPRTLLMRGLLETLQ